MTHLLDGASYTSRKRLWAISDLYIDARHVSLLISFQDLAMASNVRSSTSDRAGWQQQIYLCRKTQGVGLEGYAQICTPSIAGHHVLS